MGKEAKGKLAHNQCYASAYVVAGRVVSHVQITHQVEGPDPVMLSDWQ